MSENVMLAMARGIARSNGWNGAAATLPLYLPMNVLAAMRAHNTSHPLVEQAVDLAQAMGYADIKSNKYWSLEDNRIMRDVIVPRRKLTKKEKQEQQRQQQGEGDGEGEEGEFQSKGMSRQRDGEGEEEDDGNLPNIQKMMREAGEGEGEGQGEAQGAPEPKPMSKEMEKWIKKQNAQAKRDKQKGQKATQSQGGYGGESDMSGPSSQLASKMRSTLEKIVGSFDMEPTPLWDGKKLVKRMLSKQTLTEARKWQDGRPTISFLTDVSGSCEDMSNLITKVSTSASLLGVPGADIYAFEMSNSQLIGHGETYHNGKQHHLRYEKEYNDAYTDQNKMKRALQAMGLDVWDSSEMTNIFEAASISKRVGKPLRGDTKVVHSIPFHHHHLAGNWHKHMGEVMPKVHELQRLAVRDAVDASRTATWSRLERAKEILDWLTTKQWTQYGSGYAGGFVGEHEASSSYGLHALSAVDSDIVVYYTDSDGVEAIHSILTGLKPHQHLYVMTYANYPNLYDKSRNDVPFAMRANNKLGYHNSIGAYSRPAMRSSGASGLTIPTLALAPRFKGDYDWIPRWFNDQNSWNRVMYNVNAGQLTIFPGIDNMDGVMWAMEMIASPDRLYQAKAAAHGMRQMLIDNNMWSNMPTGWDYHLTAAYKR